MLGIDGSFLICYGLIQGKAEVGEGAENIPVASSGPPFKMSAPDGSLELEDDDDDDEGDLSSTPSTTAEDGFWHKDVRNIGL